MARIQFTTAQEKEIIEAIVNAGEVDFYGSRKWFSLGIKQTNSGQHLSDKQGITLSMRMNQLFDKDIKTLYRRKND